MTYLHDVRVAPAPSGLAEGTRGLFRWVCTNNPFYVLSALFVFVGLWTSFGAQVRAEQTFALMTGLAAYTLLLAVPACYLVRRSGVWEDVRTVLLLVVLMFLAISVTFDETLARDTGQGVGCYLIGFVFAVAVSEGMLRSIRLTLPAAFRVPYYLALALFFLYPVALVPLLDRPRSEALQWALFGFSPLAGLVALSLLPAIRRGADYVRGNGSPWPWPYYPWALFVLLGIGVVGRSFLLCWSMQHVERTDPERYIFGPYFLIPFFLSVGVVLLELGIVARSRGAQRLALAVPAGLAVLATMGYRRDDLFQGFLTIFVARFGGTPLYLTLVASAVFYGYAAWRRVSLATEGLAAALTVLAFVGPDSLGLRDVGSPRPGPLVVVGALELGLGWRHFKSWQCATGAVLLLIATRYGLTWAAPYENAVVFHLALAVAIALGTAFDDSLARALRAGGLTMAALACLLALKGRLPQADAIPFWVAQAYPPLMAAALAGYGAAMRHRPSAVVAALVLIGWVAVFGWRAYDWSRGIVPGIDFIAAGLALLAVAHMVSLAKAGLLPRWLRAWRDEAPAKSATPSLQ